MLPANVPVNAPPIGFERAVEDADTGLPRDLRKLVSAYAGTVNYTELARIGIKFDRQGRVTNPQIRNGFKEAFMSCDCSSHDKTALMRTLVYVKNSAEDGFLQAEFAKIFDEIVLSGYKIIFDEVDLSAMLLRDMNWSGISLRDANLIGLILIGTDLTNADLSGAKLNDGYWFCVKYDHARFSGAELKGLRLSRAIPAGLLRAKAP